MKSEAHVLSKLSLSISCTPVKSSSLQLCENIAVGETSDLETAGSSLQFWSSKHRETNLLCIQSKTSQGGRFGDKILYMYIYNVYTCCISVTLELNYEDGHVSERGGNIRLIFRSSTLDNGFRPATPSTSKSFPLTQPWAIDLDYSFKH